MAVIGRRERQVLADNVPVNLTERMAVVPWSLEFRAEPPRTWKPGTVVIQVVAAAAWLTNPLVRRASARLPVWKTGSGRDQPHILAWRVGGHHGTGAQACGLVLARSWSKEMTMSSKD